ncbi:85/88 kDa calcium-independent phospholipase A2 [Schistosoma japonicum]|nr:85/88 kDa calcium-independent phospholipase A2 [Schistosoma japonicum]KAH8868687.1 85/88 kDa calcium-independent phospholipase A2 [Schistosoma japonicum]
MIDLALYTLDALGTSRCPPGTVNCTGGCMDLESAEKCNLSVFNGTPPEVVHHLADLAPVEEILLSYTSLDSNYSRQISQTLRSNDNNNGLSNPYTRVNGLPLHTFSPYPENYNLNNDFIKQQKPRKKTSKLLRRNSHHSKLNRQIEPSSYGSVDKASFIIPSDSEIELNSNSQSNEQLDDSKFTGVVNNSQQSSDNTNPIKIHLEPEAATFKFKPTKCTCDRSVFTKRTETPMDLDILSTTKVNTTCSTVPIVINNIDLSNDEIKECNKNVEKNELSDSNTGDDDCDDIADDDIHFEFRNIHRLRVKQSRKWKSGPNGLRILSLDGGGMRGLVIVQLLRALEIASGKKIAEIFDWIIGTSTGAAISLFITSGKCLHCCRTLLFRFKDLVFNGKRPYPPEPLEMLMREEFGNNTVMTDLKTMR